MANMIDHKPSYYGEQKLWESLKKFLSDKAVVYNQREINGREFDFCIMMANKGIVIIEVKGWVSNKIKVNSVDNIDVEGYIEPQSSPKKQARAYRFAILNKIKSKYGVSPLVLDMVCYPFISENEYYEKNLNIISDKEYTLFSEDLEDADLMNNKIKELFQINMGIPHSEFTDELMSKIRNEQEPAYEENKDDNEHANYSVLRICPDDVEEEKLKGFISSYEKGEKNIVFYGDRMLYERNANLIVEFYKKNNIHPEKQNLYIGRDDNYNIDFDSNVIKFFNFEIYYIRELKESFETNIEFYEGRIPEAIKPAIKWLSEVSSFNIQQYEIEHATTSKNILVQAGAGTGKTFSMVSRIAFLCNKKVDPIISIADEIAMVTFTNDAAVNMKKRIKQIFINYYVLTGKIKYIQLIDEVDRSNISTIHKFAIEIMRSKSIYTGLGINFRITSNEYDRGRIYDEYIKKYLENKLSGNSNFANELSVPLFELKKKLMAVADKLLSKSINVGKISEAEMGSIVENNIPFFNELLVDIVFPAELSYSEILKQNNEMDLKNCLIELEKIFSYDIEKFRELNIKYIFIDEFQDTDNVQIEIFKLLQSHINQDCKLFVVGDLKQSIYRFRGAKLNAFQKIEENRACEWEHFWLNRNYRTDGRLLALFHEIFSNMGVQKILPYEGNKDILISDVEADIPEDEILTCVPCHGKDPENITKILNGILKLEKRRISKLIEDGKKLSNEERTIAILVRSNWQVDAVVNGAKNEDIEIEVNTGGNLFQLPSTTDLYKLLLAVCHNQSPVYLVNFIESNYINLELNYDNMHCLSKEEKIEQLYAILNEFFSRNLKYSWDEFLECMYTQPVLYVLKKVFEGLQPWKNSSKESNEQKLYIANYEYLFEKIINFFKIDTLTLNQILEYLNINIVTGQKQPSRSIESDDDNIHIVCTTVHKSKGLEYGTVILPYTYEDISNTDKIKLEASYDERKLAYFITFENGIREKNTNYNDNVEIKEQISEESRILYVALTRAISKCIWIKNLDTESLISWANLMEV